MNYKSMKERLFVLLLILPQFLLAQPEAKDWYFADPGQYNGISVDHMYHYIGDRTPKKKVIVAVLDGGVDIGHEDLKDNIWINKGEIPGNGIDDDHNGYIDDVHGWNFLGNPDGQNITKETEEVTRLYAYYRDYFKDKDLKHLSKKDSERYKDYLEYERVVQNKRSTAQQQLDHMDENREFVQMVFDTFNVYYPNQELSDAFLDSFDPGQNPYLQTAKQIFGNAKDYGLELTTVPALLDEIESSYKEITKASKDDLQYHYNPDCDVRKIVGDDPNNMKEHNYGNPDVRGGFGFHGTHVSGIIGAEWNDIGIRGIAKDVIIMPVRCVPNGDERDKDVANAIRYAVDNGADIINMSFGKGQSWNKEIVDKAVKYARKHDVLMVHAAGNDDADNDVTGNYPNDTYEHKGLFGKKVADNWIEVGASSFDTGKDAIAPFSDYGKDQVDLFAPGMQIYSTTPDNHYEYAQGTSMASPVVAGVAAVIRAYFPGLKAHEVRDILLQSVDPMEGKVDRPGDDVKVPAIELSQSGGIVNALAAYKAAEQATARKLHGNNNSDRSKEEPVENRRA